ncbi:MAG: CapA family protein [Daejeonella sp.]
MIYLLGDVWSLNHPIEISIPKLNQSEITVIANLETPVANSAIPPRPKAGPAIKGEAVTLLTLKENIPSLYFVLANNHIMDYGEAGLIDTEQACKENNIYTIGAGLNIHLARKAKIIEINSYKIGILSRCETQYGSASSSRSGVATLDPTIYPEIVKLKKEVDFILVSIHLASEMSPWPSPYCQDLYRSFIDVGADIVHGHHSHIPQGYEHYNEGVIFYGLGNFCVNPTAWSNYANTLWSLMPEIVLDNGQLSTTINTVVIEKEKDAVHIRESLASELLTHQKYIQKCNYPLNNRNLLTGLWQENSIRLFNNHYASWLGFEINKQDGKKPSKKILKRISDAIKDKQNPPLDQSQLLLRYHLFACESHCQAISTALGVLSGELEDLRTKETRDLADELIQL